MCHLEHQIHGTKACNCSVPCTRYLYDATLSNSLLDTYKIKQQVIHNRKSDTLLPKHREALEISAQVRHQHPTPWLLNLVLWIKPLGILVVKWTEYKITMHQRDINSMPFLIICSRGKRQHKRTRRCNNHWVAKEIG